MLAYQLWADSLCPCGCGQERIDVLNPKTKFEVHQTTCNARLSLLEAERGAIEERGKENHPARLFSVEKKG